jgi:hypothetical protein
MLKKIILLFVGATVLTASNKITIYNNGLALFDETKKVNTIKKGENNIVYKNVSPNVISDSVSVNLPKDVFLMEQNYKYDLVNHNNILKQYIDKKISYKKYYSQNEFNYKKGILLSVEGGFSVIETDDGIVKIANNDIIVNKLPKGMITKPSLIFRAFSEKMVKDPIIKLRYLSNGFKWKANYVATIDGEDLILNSWIKLNNNSDISLKNYSLTLLAGEVNRTRERRIYKTAMVKTKSLNALKPGSREVVEKSLGGYHIYKIPFKVNIDKLSEKQINFFNANVKNWIKTDDIKLDGYYSGKNEFKFNQVVQFKNSEKNGLGMPFPAGIMRFYQKDEDSTYFMGENRLKNIAKNENIKLSIGKDFDSVLSFQVLDRKNTKYNQYIKFEYEVRNRSQENKIYNITQRNPIHNTKIENTITKSECLTIDFCDLKEINNDYIKYTIKLKPEQTFKFKSIFKTK